MTITDGYYEVTIIANIPSDDTVSSYDATHMWLREAAHYNDLKDFPTAAADYRTTANNISDALAILEEDHVRSK